MEKQDQTICPLAKKCGGCQLQGIEYKKQLEKKKKQVQQALPAGIQVRPVIGMEDPYHYRNKIHAAFGRTKKGEIIYGVYEAGTHKIVPVEHCLIQNEAADAILADIRDLLKSLKIKN